MIGRNDRSATIYRRSGVNQVHVRVVGDRCLRGHKACLLLKHGKGVELTSQHKGGGRETRRPLASHVPTDLMLTAFQARKVRLATTPGLQDQTTLPLTAASPDPQSPAPDSTPRRPSRKRKPEPVAENEAVQSQRRKKMDDRRGQGKVRYFDAPVDVPEPDLHSSDESISLSDQETLSQSHAQPQRAWSLSQPLLDSSDDEMVTETGGVQAVGDALATSFSAELDVNTFRLSPEECFALINLEESATAMILPVHSSITLTGVYQLTVLQGAVVLMGVTLTSSEVSHAVFAPKLSPLPCIESFGNTDPASPLINNVPLRLRSRITQEHAVILICAHPTGIEGLGRVMRTFESMFQPSQSSKSNVDLGIPGAQIHMVCALFGLPITKIYRPASGTKKNETSWDFFSRRLGTRRFLISSKCVLPWTEETPQCCSQSYAKSLAQSLLGRVHLQGCCRTDWSHGTVF